MIKTINLYDFLDAFEYEQYRGDKPFSYAGLVKLFEYLEMLEEEQGSDLEFDPVSIRGYYHEYDDMEEFWEDFEKEDYPDLTSIEDDGYVVIRINDSAFITSLY